MIYFDATKSAPSKHHSGLLRVSTRLRAAMGNAVTTVRWVEGAWRTLDGRQPTLAGQDWLLTPELFSEAERPGFSKFVSAKQCRLAAIFHDAIPLKLPHVTWPQSVARHPEYLKLLASFDRVFAVSRASAEELTGFWKWQGVGPTALVQTIALGADLSGVERVQTAASTAKGPPLLLCVGILEPRKNQALLADVAERLYAEKLVFRMEFVGRVNPHFGKPIAQRLRALERRHPMLRFHEALPDEALKRLWSEARATLFPTRAEGCGLPLLESLWMAVPCVYSDLPVLRENADGGGCKAVPLGDLDAWSDALRSAVLDAAEMERLRSEATARALPTWGSTAEELLTRLNAD